MSQTFKPKRADNILGQQKRVPAVGACPWELSSRYRHWMEPPVTAGDEAEG